jgi:hypothetical protein
MRIIICCFAYLLFQLSANCQYSDLPKEVALTLSVSKKRNELEKLIAYYKKEGDALKLKAAYYLIANMRIHYSSDYYWSSANGTRLKFNELDYKNLSTSVAAFEKIKVGSEPVKPVSTVYYDMDSLTADYLIENINQSFVAWKKNSRNISFDNFCEYILPYRISVEPLQNWRGTYQKKFQWVGENAVDNKPEQYLPLIAADFNKWFTNTYKIEAKTDPLPRLGAMQLLLRKKGPCEDIADLQVFLLRSQGIPASVDEVPLWATSSGNHFLNVCFDKKMRPVSFDISTPKVTEDKLAREPAKVIRRTYSIQKNTIGNMLPLNEIPEGFMRTVNYVDVTSEYWPTKDVHCGLFSDASNQKVVYACVFNFLSWRPSWWGVPKTSSVTFKGMCKGAVFLPMVYNNGKLKPAGYPVASGYNNTLVLQPDTHKMREINLTEQAGYLVFKPGKKYRLFYWNNKWELISETIAKQNMNIMSFKNVPTNALLLLVSEQTQHKERPFIINNQNNRIWF